MPMKRLLKTITAMVCFTALLSIEAFAASPEPPTITGVRSGVYYNEAQTVTITGKLELLPGAGKESAKRWRIY